MKHQRMKAPIQSRKHYVHLSNAVTTTGTLLSFEAVNAVVAPATSLPADIQEGSVIKAVYFEIWIYGLGASGTDTQFFMAIEKLTGGQPEMTFAQSATLGAYPNKKNILYTTQGVIGGIDTNSIPIIKNWLLIPKGKQRFGLGDRLQVNISALGANINRCGIMTFKEYN